LAWCGIVWSLLDVEFCVLRHETMAILLHL